MLQVSRLPAGNRPVDLGLGQQNRGVGGLSLRLVPMSAMAPSLVDDPPARCTEIRTDGDERAERSVVDDAVFPAFAVDALVGRTQLRQPLFRLDDHRGDAADVEVPICERVETVV